MGCNFESFKDTVTFMIVVADCGRVLSCWTEEAPSR